MARNLRSKINQSDTMYIHDVNPAVCERLQQEVGNVNIANSVRDVANNAVCLCLLVPAFQAFLCCDEFNSILPMI